MVRRRTGTLQHLTSLSLSGSGVVIDEMTAVEPEGRITPACLGLYSNENEAALERILATCRCWGNTKIRIQLVHAGRKASVDVPWRGGRPWLVKPPGERWRGRRSPSIPNGRSRRHLMKKVWHAFASGSSVRPDAPTGSVST